MEEDEIYNGPVPAYPAEGAIGNGYYHRESYPERVNMRDSYVMIKNVDYMIKLFDAAALRVSATGDLEFLVDDPDGGGTLVWLDVTELEVPAPVEH